MMLKELKSQLEDLFEERLIRSSVSSRGAYVFVG